jgi:predicted GIY-YIG superfamily endonuclease
MQYYFYTLSADSDPNNIRYVGVTTRLLKQRMYGHRYNATKKEKRNQPVHK